MAIIRFQLKPFEEIPPWGNADQGFSLSWFGLSYAYYWFEFDGTEVLRYSDLAMAECPGSPYVDYQFCRIFDDLGHLLEDVRTAVPDEVFPLVQGLGGVTRMPEMLCRWLDQERQGAVDGGDSIRDRLFYPAMEWLSYRRLGFEYLVDSPEVYFLRRGDQVHVHWSCEGRASRGYEMWQAKDGHCVISLDVFLRQVFEVFDDFVAQMGRRVSQVVACNPFVDVNLDFGRLQQSQDEVADALAHWKMRLQRLPRPREVDWAETVRALGQLREMPEVMELVGSRGPGAPGVH